MAETRRFDSLEKVVRDDRRSLDDLSATVLSRLGSHTHEHTHPAPPDGPVAQIYQTAVQSIPNNVLTAITMNAETFDSHSGHSTVSQTSRWTCPVAWDGYYMVSGVVYYASGTAGVRAALLRTNGATYVRGSVQRVDPAADGFGNGVATSASIIRLFAGDYVEVMAIHTQGAAVNTFSDSTYSSGMHVAYQRGL